MPTIISINGINNVKLIHIQFDSIDTLILSFKVLIISDDSLYSLESLNMRSQSLEFELRIIFNRLNPKIVDLSHS